MVDDLASVTPWVVRGIEVRGKAEMLEAGAAGIGPGYDEAMFRIRPSRVVAWGARNTKPTTPDGKVMEPLGKPSQATRPQERVLTQSSGPGSPRGSYAVTSASATRAFARSGPRS